jgi:hypothetical protein
MRMIASFARVTERCTGHLYLHCLLIFQQFGEISKTCNQLDDTVGRVRERLSDFGTMRLLTACAVRAAARFGRERRSVPFDTTSRSGWGADEVAQEQAVPVRVTSG